MTPKDLVLCVDDEPTLLRACTAAVQRVGFRAEAAEDGATGLALFRERRDEVCLVLTDIVMPGINGIDMAQRMLQLKTHTKILLMSADSDLVIGRQVRRRQLPLIRKPFNYAKLIEEIRSTVGVPEATKAADWASPPPKVKQIGRTASR
jgi:DNA-binding NtrC family response regulator